MFNKIWNMKTKPWKKEKEEWMTLTFMKSNMKEEDMIQVAQITHLIDQVQNQSLHQMMVLKGFWKTCRKREGKINNLKNLIQVKNIT